MSSEGPLDRSPYPATGGELAAVLAAERTGEAFLMLRDHGGTHRVRSLTAGQQAVTIGRHSGNDIVVGWDERVSRVHARLEHMAAEWTVIDDGISRNGTFVDGARVSGRVRLHDGCSLKVGDTVLGYRDPRNRSGAMTAVADLQVVPRAITEAQMRVLLALCRPYRHGAGLVTPASNAQIAEELVLSIDAVKTHMRSLFQKFEVGDLPQNQKRLRVVECAFGLGIISERDL